MTDARVSGAATDAWAALERTSFSKRRGVLESAGRRKRASLWTLVHVLWAIGDLRRLGASEAATIDIVNMVDRYRWRAGFAAAPGTKRRFFDDDAWLGLVALDLDDRQLAAEALAFVRTGEDPEGGVRWVEDAASRNTCSTASAAWLAIELGDRVFAARAMSWLDATLRTDEGLYQDRLEKGRIDPTLWSYNQGAAVAALGLLGRPDAATTTVTASLGLFTGERLWREPPPFLAIWFRALLRDPVARTGAARRLVAHTDRLLAQALDPATGLFTGSGVGSYDGSTTIDQAATVQMFAMRALAGA
ncbi:MAG: glycoside hydrolase family 76 protein [Actinomycetota bacterium]